MKTKSILIVGFLFLLTTCEWDLPKKHIKLLSQTDKNQCDTLQQDPNKICATKKIAIANYVSNPIVIDGFEEAAWNNSQEYPISNSTKETPIPLNNDDFSANFKVLWDNYNLYILIKIKDDIEFDSPTFSPSTLYIFDYFEIFTNPDFSNDSPFDEITTNFNGDAMCIGISRGITEQGILYHHLGKIETLNNGDTVIWQQQNTQYGWWVECSYKWSCILPQGFALRDLIGFEVKVHDKDNNSTPYSLLVWANDTRKDDSYRNTGTFGYLQLQ